MSSISSSSIEADKLQQQVKVKSDFTYIIELSTALFVVTVATLLYFHNRYSYDALKYYEDEDDDSQESSDAERIEERWIEESIDKTLNNLSSIIDFFKPGNHLKRTENQDTHRNASSPSSILRNKASGDKSPTTPKRELNLRFKKTIFESPEDRREPSEVPRYTQDEDISIFYEVLQSLYENNRRRNTNEITNSTEDINGIIDNKDQTFSGYSDSINGDSTDSDSIDSDSSDSDSSSSSSSSISSGFGSIQSPSSAKVDNTDLRDFIGFAITPDKTEKLRVITTELCGNFERVYTEDYASIFQSYSDNIKSIEEFDQIVSSASLALLMATQNFESEEEVDDFVGVVTPLFPQFYDCVSLMKHIVTDLQRGSEGLLNTINELLHMFGTEFRDFRDVELALEFCNLYLASPDQDGERLVRACERFDPVNVPHTLSTFSSYRNVETELIRILSELNGLPFYFKGALRECELIHEELEHECEIGGSIKKGESCVRLLVAMQSCTDLIESLEYYASNVEKYYLLVYEYLRQNREHIRIAEHHDMHKLSRSIGSCLLDWNYENPHIDVAGTAHVFKPSFVS